MTKGGIRLKRWIAALLAALILCSALALAEEAPSETEAPAEAPVEEATDAPAEEATDSPSETEQPRWLLTIRYLYEDRTEAHPAQQLTLAEGEAYDVEPPAVEGYAADPERVKGTMPAGDWTEEVIYRAEQSAEPDATAEPTEAPGETAEPVATPEPAGPDATEAPGAGWTLTIRYVLPNGEPAAEDYVLTGLASGQAYDVESPQIEGMTADQPRVSGVMGEADVTVTVTYGGSGDFSDGFPGGGGHGGSRPSGTGSAGGMTGEEGTEQPGDAGFQVTAGEAFTSIHSSGDQDDSLYGALDPDDETVAALNLSLTADGAEQSFSAQWADGALILTGDAGQWNLGGDALRALNAGGVETLVLISGDSAVVLPTGGFVSGYAYDCLRAQGLPSASFAYAVDPSMRTVQLTAQGVTYELAAEGGDMQLTGAAFDDPDALWARYASEDE